jgi:Fe-S cluster biosynthesis and repair protein YggX
MVIKPVVKYAWEMWIMKKQTEDKLLIFGRKINVKNI